MSYGGPPPQGQQQQRSRVVFVGNLPFDQTEEQLVDVFNSVGPVVSFRLVFDRETGKPKGFGFCEYRDPETAASALRNLQGVEVGGRGLRLDFADTDEVGGKKKESGAGGSGGAGGGGRGGRGGRNDGATGGGGGGMTSGRDLNDYGGGGRTPLGGAQNNESARPLPPGVPLPVGASAVDNISQTLATMPPGQLLDIMSQMKALVTTSPVEARNLLASNPQLAYALFQAMLMMNLVDSQILQKILPQPNTAGGVPPPGGMYGHPQQQTMPNSYGAAPVPPNAYMGGRPAPPPHVYPGQAGNLTPQHQPAPGGYGNYQSGSYGGAAPQPPPSQPVPAGVAPDQAALIAQVLSMTQAQIDVLPEDSRKTIMQIRAQAAASMGGMRR